MIDIKVLKADPEAVKENIRKKFQAGNKLDENGNPGVNKNGRAIANQYVITYNDGRVGFQSYNTMICIWDENNDELIVNTHYRDYGYTAGYQTIHSQTTTRNLNIFLKAFTPYESLKDAEGNATIIYEPMYRG